MFESLEGVPPVLAEYFRALNEHDLDRAIACVAPDATLVVEEDADHVLRAEGHADVERWLRRSERVGTVTIAPLTATADGPVTSILLAVTVYRSASGVASLLQQVDYTVENGLIVAVRSRPARRMRDHRAGS